MGSSANRLRNKWQDYSGRNAGRAEMSFYKTFEILFEGTEFQIDPKPKEFNKIYVDIELSSEVLLEIYNPTTPVTIHGVKPDYAIRNLESGKTMYVEVKRQDGWVEGKDRSAGRGNAHERSCKFFSPGLLKVLRQHGKITDFALPFWTVFQGDITRDPCRVREIALWFDTYVDHYFFWRNPSNQEPLIEHFLQKIKPLLE